MVKHRKLADKCDGLFLEYGYEKDKFCCIKDKVLT
jgi:hypothetical protein